MKLATYTPEQSRAMEDALIAVMQREGPLRVSNRDHQPRGDGHKISDGTLTRQARQRIEAGKKTRAEIYRYIEWRHPDLVTATEIAQHMNLTQTSVRWALRRMHEEGMLARFERSTAAGYAWTVAVQEAAE